MKHNLFFSIIIPTYNRAAHIERTICSALEQVYPLFEIIVVDDGSTDNTAAVVGGISDDRIHYFRKENGERGAARNFGTKRAKGDFITFLDSDDVLYDSHLAVAAQAVLEFDTPEVFHLGYEIRNINGTIISQIAHRENPVNQQLVYGNILSCIGVFIRRDIAKKHLFKEDRKLTGSEDYELWLRLAARYPIYTKEKITAALIQHQARSILSFNQLELEERINKLIECLKNDSQYISRYGRYEKVFIAHRLLYISLHLILSRCTLCGLRYWFVAFKSHPPIIFHRKTLGIIKNIILNR